MQLFFNIALWDTFVMEILLQSDFIHHVAYISLSPRYLWSPEGKKELVCLCESVSE